MTNNSQTGRAFRHHVRSEEELSNTHISPLHSVLDTDVSTALQISFSSSFLLSFFLSSSSSFWADDLSGRKKTLNRGTFSAFVPQKGHALGS
jgi:hypothetical protein